MSTIRTFLAVEFDDAFKRSLARLQSRLDAGGRGVRWMRPEEYHLTLKFVGDLEERDLPEICDLLTEMAVECKPFEMELKGAGCFPPAGGVRIVWAGLSEPTGRLAELQSRSEALFSGLGYKQEHRAFSPHVTIARVRDARRSQELRAAVGRHADFSGGTQAVDEVVLFQSILEREGPRYVAMSRHHLGEEA